MFIAYGWVIASFATGFYWKSVRESRHWCLWNIGDWNYFSNLQTGTVNTNALNPWFKYRGLVDNSLVGVFHSRLSGQFIFVNEALVRMFDFESPEQMLLEEAVARWSDPNRRDHFLTTLQEQGYRQPVCTPFHGHWWSRWNSRCN